MRRLAPLVVVAALATSPAWAVYRCQIGNRVVYQDMPCETGAIAKTMPKVYTPDRAEQLLARARVLRQEAAVGQIQVNRMRADQARDREMRKRAECERRERDVLWTEATAKKYKKDTWWQNQAINDRQRFAEDCWAAP